MKTTCYVPGCGASLVGVAKNIFRLVDDARERGEGWLAFMDVRNGLESCSLCPAHSPPVEEATKLLISVFGEEKFSHINLGLPTAIKKPIVVPAVEELARG